MICKRLLIPLHKFSTKRHEQGGEKIKFNSSSHAAKFLDSLGIMDSFHSSGKESAGPMAGQLKKMGKEWGSVEPKIYYCSRRQVYVEARCFFRNL